MSEKIDFEQLSYGLILLEEICQGYDNGEYRVRCATFINNSGYRYKYMQQWFMHRYPTTKLIDDIETFIENYAAEQTDSEKSSVSRGHPDADSSGEGSKGELS